jgi:hypothetical protein
MEQEKHRHRESHKADEPRYEDDPTRSGSQDDLTLARLIGRIGRLFDIHVAGHDSLLDMSTLKNGAAGQKFREISNHVLAVWPIRGCEAAARRQSAKHGDGGINRDGNNNSAV